MMFCFSMYFIYRLRIIKQLEVNNSSFYTSIENSFCINMVCLSIKHLAFYNLDMYTIVWLIIVDRKVNEKNTA